MTLSINICEKFKPDDHVIENQRQSACYRCTDYNTYTYLQAFTWILGVKFVDDFMKAFQSCKI